MLFQLNSKKHLLDTLYVTANVQHQRLKNEFHMVPTLEKISLLVNRSLC